MSLIIVALAACPGRFLYIVFLWWREWHIHQGFRDTVLPFVSQLPRIRARGSDLETGVLGSRPVTTEVGGFAIDHPEAIAAGPLS